MTKLTDNQRKAEKVYRYLVSLVPDDFETKFQELGSDMCGIYEFRALEDCLNKIKQNFLQQVQLIYPFLTDDESSVWLSKSTHNNLIHPGNFWVRDSLEDTGIQPPDDGQTHHYSLNGEEIINFREHTETCYVLQGEKQNPLSYRVCTWLKVRGVSNFHNKFSSFRAISKRALYALLESL